jgi:hypothetical protein
MEGDGRNQSKVFVVGGKEGMRGRKRRGDWPLCKNA